MRPRQLSEKEKIRLHFNRAEAGYDEHCHLQVQVGKHLIKHTQPIQPCAAHILDVGCGTGIITNLLTQSFQAQQVSALDIAERLLAVAKKRAHHNIHLYQADFDDIKAYPNLYDLIISNMVLQWSMDLTTTLRTIKSALQPSTGLLAFSIPVLGTLSELQKNYSLNNLPTMQSIREKLAETGYSLIFQQQEQIILTFNDTLSALRSIKHIGANYVSDRTHTGLRGKAFLNHHDCKQLTYEIGYFIAR